MVSANSLALRHRKGHPLHGEWKGWRADLSQLPADCALDSAGFVAWSHYGDFGWTPAAYLDLVAANPWRWWASMDACCEPEVAGDPGIVRMRQAETLRLLAELRAGAEARGLPAPMPVLQGWTPAEYVWCAEQALDGSEALVGVGSMCRRNLHSTPGAPGLLDVVDALDDVLPPGVKLHLFGVKSAGLQALAGHPRLASIDSMAWDAAARRSAASSSNTNRIAHMTDWHGAQVRMVANAASRPAQSRMAFRLDPPSLDEATEEWSRLVAGGEIELRAALPHWQCERMGGEE